MVREEKLNWLFGAVLAVTVILVDVVLVLRWLVGFAVPAGPCSMGGAR